MAKSKSQLIAESRRKLGNQYAHLNPDGGYDADFGVEAIDETAETFVSVSAVRGGSVKKRSSPKTFAYTSREIERIARRMQVALWKRHQKLRGRSDIADPMAVVRPSSAFELLGYEYLREPLGPMQVGSQSAEVAGVVESSRKRVSVSPQFPAAVQNFTAAHELGHAILHEGQGLHRDRPLDGSQSDWGREPIEQEADQFASFFLMPEKVVRQKFRSIFGLNCVEINDDCLSAFAPADPDRIRRRCRTLRQLARFIAMAEFYGGRHFDNLASQFNVSSEAMAIRLEELGLVRL